MPTKHNKAGQRRAGGHRKRSEPARRPPREGHKPAGRKSAKQPEADIPGTGESPQMTAAVASVSVPTSAEFDRIVAVRSRPLLKQSPEAAAGQITEVFLPALAGFNIGASYGLYWYLGTGYALTDLILRVSGHPAHLAAIKHAAGIADGVEICADGKPYMKVLQALGPLPTEDGSGDRRRLQNRYSNYNCAMEAADAEGLDAREFFERLVTDRGIEKLVEQARQAAKKPAQSAPEREGEDDDWSQSWPRAASARSQDRKRDREQKEATLRGFAAKARSESRAGGGDDQDDEDEGELPFADSKPGREELTVAVNDDVRPLLAKAGKYVMVTRVSGSGCHHIAVRYAQPLPAHSHPNDGEALRAMVRSLRK